MIVLKLSLKQWLVCRGYSGSVECDLHGNITHVNDASHQLHTKRQIASFSREYFAYTRTVGSQSMEIESGELCPSCSEIPLFGYEGEEVECPDCGEMIVIKN